MLHIRQAQFDAFEKVNARRFEERLIRDVESRFPEEDSTGEELRARVRRGIARAEAYEIESESHISEFVFLMMEFGDRFEERTHLPFVTNVLGSVEISGAAKMPAIAARRASLRRRKERAANESV